MFYTSFRIEQTAPTLEDIAKGPRNDLQDAMIFRPMPPCDSVVNR
jgi:hypothetical protein